MAIVPALTTDDLLKSLNAKLRVYFELLERQGTAGSIVAEIHCSENGVKKIKLGLTEVWAPGSTIPS